MTGCKRPPSDNPGLAFFTDAKAEDGRAWVGIVPGCQGPWFSLEVDSSWAPWAFSKSSPNKVIAARAPRNIDSREAMDP